MKRYCKLFSISIFLFSIFCEKNPVNNNPQIQTENRILFIRSVDGFSQICTVKPDGTDLIIISQTELGINNIGYQQAKWSPEKSRIVVVGRPDSSFEILPVWLMDNDGNLLQKLSNNGYEPIWLSNSEIYYYKPRGQFGSKQDLYLIDIQTKVETEIDSLSGSFDIKLKDIHMNSGIGVGFLTNDSLSHEINSIVVTFPISDWNSYDIVINDNLRPAVPPRISPNEETIIFVKGIYQNNDIFTLDLLSGNETNITKNPSEYRTVMWAPDSKQIAYDVPEQRPFERSVADIYIINVLTGQTINLTNTGSLGMVNHLMDWK